MKRISHLLLLLLLVIVSANASNKELYQKLCTLKGVITVDSLPSDYSSEKYVVTIRQPLDHKHPDKGSFTQRVVISHEGFDRPTVLVTEGYGGDYALNPRYRDELARLFQTNTVFVEHRYFSGSVPDSVAWQYLTAQNSASDLHIITTLFKQIYPQKWISTGISKGGQTALIYRAFFPNDVDITVPYVAPVSRSAEDGRHEPFQNKVGDKKTRQAILSFQREVLKRRGEIIPLLEKFCLEKQLSFRISMNEVLDYCVLEYSFAFWQWGTPASHIPANTATTGVLFKHLTEISGPDYFATGQPTQAFFIQAARELGYYGYDIEPFKDLLFIRTAKDYLQRIMLPEGITIQFQPELYKKLTNFIETSDPRLIFVYGEYDPWTSVGITKLDGKKNMFVAIQPKGSHRARINTLPDSLRDKVIKTINLWLEK
ncbi:MAG TPA: S28 family serine protease [Macellibacteroides fermentans]|uniref:S28 family serine protease n=1 Tax=Macellibacteroides fermentans TaxID=879969 RepID=UPI002BC2209A|nr:S28 family serine protease [Macellibacteroides fermentans]